MPLTFSEADLLATAYRAWEPGHYYVMRNMPDTSQFTAQLREHDEMCAHLIPPLLLARMRNVSSIEEFLSAWQDLADAAGCEPWLLAPATIICPEAIADAIDRYAAAMPSTDDGLRRTSPNGFCAAGVDWRITRGEVRVGVWRHADAPEPLIVVQIQEVFLAMPDRDAMALAEMLLMCASAQADASAMSDDAPWNT